MPHHHGMDTTNTDILCLHEWRADSFTADCDVCGRHAEKLVGESADDFLDRLADTGDVSDR
jgi:hypothetical protein